MFRRSGSMVALIALLGACGGGGSGGGGSGIVSTPTPTPTPTPAPPPPPMTATLFAVPIDGDLTVYSVAKEAPSGSPYDLTGATTAGETSVSIRYIAAEQRYEVSAPGVAPSTLNRRPYINWQDRPFADLVSSIPVDQGEVAFHLPYPAGTVAGSDDPTLLASYHVIPIASSGLKPTTGSTAFGMATPASAIPTTGTATYLGLAHGYYQELSNDNWSVVDGTVTIGIDFGVGQVSGSMTIGDVTEPGWGGPDIGSIGTFNLLPAALSSQGSFATAFDTTGTGTNLFKGSLAGPTAGHAFGIFAVPFTKGGRAFDSWGSWTAKR